MSTLAPPDHRAAASRSGEPAPDPGPTTARVAAGAGVAVLAMRLLALALSVGTAVLLARLLGAAGLGVYETAMGWAALLGVPAGAGVEKLVVREIATARAHGHLGVVRGLARTSVAAVLTSAAVVATATGAAVLLLGDRAPTGLLLVALGVVPLAALLRVRQAVMQGLARVVRGQLSELLVVPAAFVALLVTVTLTSGGLTPTAALLCQAGAFAVGLALAISMLRRSTSPALRTSEPVTDLHAWALAALPLLGIAGLQVLNARVDVVLLGAIAEPAEVGRYACAHRLAALVAMPLLAANAALGPTLARLHAQGERADLQRAVTRSVRWTAAVALPIAVSLLLGGTLALSVFGEAFVAARDLLTLLTLAQLANVAMGSVGLILLMTGHARTAMQGLALSAVLNVGLDVLLIPELGALGAAIGAASSLLAWNILLLVGVRRRLDLHPTVLGGPR